MIDLSRRHAARILAAFAAAAFLVSCGGSDDNVSQPPLFQTTVVFGASLSDTGNACTLSAANCPPSPPYAPGRYSNGSLWVEVLASRYGAAVTPSLTGGNNFAYAGARTGTVPGAGTVPGTAATVPSMLAQLDTYLTRVNFILSAQTLFVVDGATVGNNISDALTLAAANPSQATTISTNVLTQAVTDVVTIVNRLYASGARHIAVLNSTDIGRTPRVQAINAVSPGAAAAATQLSNQFNGALAQQIAIIRAASPGVNIYLIDFGALTNEIVATPASFGFNNVSAPCFNPSVTPPTVCATPNTYVFWDPFHPTVAAGAVLANRAQATIGR
ncbi:MAG: SGNH/GDSL hydrolase family protein [Burkholderiaceae bacterium]